jgi:hypothetical protein
MYTVYYDDSGSPNDTPVVVVAGLLASDEQWVEFERNWNETLQRFGISLFHMKEFAHSRGEFSKWKEHQAIESQRLERERFLRQLLAHIVLRVQHSFAHAVIMDDYRAVNEIYPLAEGDLTPYALCGRTCLARASVWADKYGIPEQNIQHIFEDGSLGKGSFIDRATKDKGITPTFKKKPESVPLQAADLFAYEYFLGCRDIFQKGIDTLERLRFPIRRLEPIPHEQMDWGTYSRDDLERFCANIGAPQRRSWIAKAGG